MKPLPRNVNLTLFAAFATFMVATRFHHFGDVLHLPDASMALFFLGGLYLRKHWQFAAFIALAVVIDWIAIEHAGVSDFCVTPAYSFLLPAYAVLWYGGRLYADRLQVSWRSSRRRCRSRSPTARSTGWADATRIRISPSTWPAHGNGARCSCARR